MAVMLDAVDADVRLAMPLFQQAPLLKDVIDAMDTEVVLLNEELVIVAANNAWMRFAASNGGRRDGYVGEPYAFGDNDDVARGLRRVQSGQDDRYEHVYPCDGPDEERWFVMRARRLEWGDERGVLVIHNDVTALKRLQALEQEEQEIKVRAEEAEKRRDFQALLLNRVAHEISTPLTPIRMQLGRMENAKSEIEQAAAKQMLERNVARLQVAIEAMAFTVGLETGQRKPRSSRTTTRDLAAGLRTALDDHEHVAVEIEGSVPVEVDATLWSEALGLWVIGTDAGGQAVTVAFREGPAQMVLSSNTQDLASSGVADLLIEGLAAAEGAHYERTRDKLTVTFGAVEEP